MGMLLHRRNVEAAQKPVAPVPPKAEEEKTKKRKTTKQ